MLNITNHQRNENQNHNKISLQICQKGYHHKDHKEQMLMSMWRKGKLYTLLVGMYILVATRENNMEFPQKISHKTTI